MGRDWKAVMLGRWAEACEKIIDSGVEEVIKEVNRILEDRASKYGEFVKWNWKEMKPEEAVLQGKRKKPGL